MQKASVRPLDMRVLKHLQTGSNLPFMKQHLLGFCLILEDMISYPLFMTAVVAN